MEVTETLCAWLQHQQVLTSPAQLKKGRIVISEEDAQAFEIGLRFAPLLSSFNQVMSRLDRPVTPSVSLHNLKNLSSIAGRLFNWNILIKVFERFGIGISADTKALIVAGDRLSVREIMEKLYNMEQRELEQQEYERQERMGITNIRRKKKTDRDGALLIENIETGTMLADSENCLEFLILSFCNCFDLNPKQSAGLLTESGKYLTHVLMKGIKGDFTPVRFWLETLRENAAPLGKLIEKEIELGSFELIMGAVRPGFDSPDSLSVELIVKFLVSLHSYLKSLQQEMWNWAVDFGLMQKVLLVDNPSLQIEWMFEFGKNKLYKVMTEMLPELFDKKRYFEICSSIVNWTKTRSKFNNKLENQGVILSWVSQASEEEEDPDTQLCAISFLCELWNKFHKYIGQNEECANLLFAAAKKGCNSKQNSTKITCAGLLFGLLSKFANNKNSYAPIIYKTLSFMLVENYTNEPIREFFVHNFIVLVSKIQSIPIGVLIEPLLKHYQHSEFTQFNIFDFDLFIAASRHPRTEVKEAILLLDILFKVSLTDIFYSKLSYIPIFLLTNRFMDHEATKDYLLKFISVSLKLLQSKIQTKKQSRMQTAKAEFEGETTIMHIRDFVLSLTEKFISYEDFQFNEKLKEILLESHYEISQITGETFKGIFKVLSMLGDAESFIAEHEQSKNVVAIPETRTEVVLTTPSVPKTTLYSVAFRKPKGRADSDIKRIKERRDEEEYRMHLINEIQREEEETKKRNLKKAIDKRRQELGIPSKTQDEGPVILDINSTYAESENYVNLDEEPDYEVELIIAVIKQYSHITRYLFSAYACSGYKKVNYKWDTFEVSKQNKNSLTDGEVSKMLRDLKISKEMLTAEEIKSIYDLVLHKLKVNLFTYDLFLNFLLQISVKIFHQNFLQYPLAVSFKALFEYMKNSDRIPKKTGVGDPDILEHLNSALEADPDIEIPQGYKIVKEPVITVRYELPNFIDPSFKLAYETLDGILFNALNLHLVEPLVEIHTVNRVKGMLAKPVVKEPTEKTIVPANSAVYKAKPLPAYLNLYPTIKIEVAKLQTFYPSNVLIACAKVIDDLIYTVDLNSNNVVSRNPRPPGSISNQAFHSKSVEEQQIRHAKQKAEALRRKRAKALEDDVKKIRELKAEHEKSILETRLKELQIARVNEMKRREKYLKDKEEKNRQIKEFHMKKAQEEISKKLEEAKMIKALEDKKNRDRNLFYMKEKVRLEQRKQQVATPEPQNAPKNTLAKKNSKSLDEKMKRKMDAAAVDDLVYGLLEKYGPSIEALFYYYSSNDKMNRFGFLKFVKEFSMIDRLASKDDFNMIFGSELDSQSFKEALVKVSVLCQSSLQKELSKSLESFADQFAGLLKWMRLPEASEDVQQMLKLIRTVQEPSGAVLDKASDYILNE